MARRSLAFLVAILIYGMPMTVFAADDQTINENGVIGSSTIDFYMDGDNEPGFMEKNIAEPMISTANWILGSFRMKDVSVLVFGRNPTPDRMTDIYQSGSKFTCKLQTENLLNGGLVFLDWFSQKNEEYKTCMQGKKIGEKLDDFLVGDCVGRELCNEGRILGIFDNGMMEAIDILYGVFEVFLPFPIVIGLMAVGLFILLQGMTSSGRSSAKDYATAFIVALLSLRFGYYLWVMIAYIVRTFTEIIWATLTTFGVKPNLFLDMVWGTGIEGFQNLSSIQSLAVALIVLSAALMTFALNYQYILRLIMLMVLIVIFPVTCTMAVFPRFRHSLQTWWEEFLSNMILPVAHAIALGLFFLVLHYSSMGVSIWVIIAYFFGLPTIYNLVRRLVGAEETSNGLWGGLAGAAGLASIGALGKMFTPVSALGGSKKANKESTTAGSTIAGSNEVNEGGTFAIAGSSSKFGAVLGAVKNMGGKAMPTAGKMAGYGLRTAGALTGYAVGSMTGNAAAGTVLGGMVGGSIGKRADYAVGTVAPKVANKVGGWYQSLQSKSDQSIATAQMRDYNQEVVPSQFAYSPEMHEPGQATHIRANYEPAGEDFWNSISLNQRYDRNEVVDWNNTGRLDHQTELENTFLNGRASSRDHYF